MEQQNARRMVIFLFALVAVAALWGLLRLRTGTVAGGGEEGRARRTPEPTAVQQAGPLRTRVPLPTLVAATRVPAPIPIPTYSPLWITRGISAPAAPEALSQASAVVNVLCVGDCTTEGSASWLTSDTRVDWTHPDPLAVDYYEVWTAVDEPYFETGTCMSCTRAATTTGLEAVIANTPPGFNPVGRTEGAEIMSPFQLFRVRACNAGGCSADSNLIGAVNVSLLQGNGEAALQKP